MQHVSCTSTSRRKRTIKVLFNFGRCYRCSHTEQSTFILRYVLDCNSSFVVKERFLAFVDYNQKTGQDIADMIRGVARLNFKRRQTLRNFPKARSRFRVGGLRERSKLPQGSLGRSPRNQRDFQHFMPKRANFGLLLTSYF